MARHTYDLSKVFYPGNQDRKQQRALFAEFYGTALFVFLAFTLKSSYDGVSVAIAFAASAYIVGQFSGGLLNPAVTLASVLTGHLSTHLGALYALVQIVGGFFGALVAALLLPGAHIFHHSTQQIGCPPAFGNVGQAFLWELILTTALIVAFYSTAYVSSPTPGLTPAVVGLVIAAAGNSAHSAGLNPAALLGPNLVFGCQWGGRALLHLLGQLTASLLSAVITAGVFGIGVSTTPDIDDGGAREPLITPTSV